MYLKRIIITFSAFLFLQLLGCSANVTSQLRDDRVEVVISGNAYNFATPSEMTALEHTQFNELQSRSRTVLSGRDFNLVGFFIEGSDAAKSVSTFINATEERYPADQDRLAQTPRSVQIYLMDRGYWGFSKFDMLVKAYWKYKRNLWDKYAASRTFEGVAYKRKIEQKNIRTIENSRDAKVAVFALDNTITVGQESFHHKTITAEGIININETLFVLEVNSKHESLEDLERVVEVTREILRNRVMIYETLE